MCDYAVRMAPLTTPSPSPLRKSCLYREQIAPGFFLPKEDPERPPPAFTSIGHAHDRSRPQGICVLRNRTPDPAPFRWSREPSPTMPGRTRKIVIVWRYAPPRHSDGEGAGGEVSRTHLPVLGVLLLRGKHKMCDNKL